MNYDRWMISISATCDYCGKEIYLDDPRNLAQALAVHERTCKP